MTQAASSSIKPCPARRFYREADHEVCQHGGAEYVAQETCQARGCSEAFFGARSSVAHRSASPARNKEADSDEAGNDDDQAVEVLPITKMATPTRIINRMVGSARRPWKTLSLSHPQNKVPGSLRIRRRNRPSLCWSGQCPCRSGFWAPSPAAVSDHVTKALANAMYHSNLLESNALKMSRSTVPARFPPNSSSRHVRPFLDGRKAAGLGRVPDRLWRSARPPRRGKDRFQSRNNPYASCRTRIRTRRLRRWPWGRPAR